MGEALTADRVDGRSERYFTPSEKSEIVAEICERLALVRPADGSQAIDVTPERKKPSAD